jgi:hypothetical protein
MKRLIAVTFTAVALIALMAPVYAQRKGSAKNPEEEQKRQEAERIDRQYKATLKRMGDKTENAVIDPWKGMRGTDDSKTKR